MNAYNNQFAEKLNNVRGNVRRSEDYFQEERGSRFTLPAANTIGIDGVDHINIWEHACTEFGIILDQFQDTPFEHPMYGRFRSIEGFWHYLRSPTRDDRNRTTFGFRAKTMGDKQRFERVDNFRYIIMHATWHKVKQYPAIVKEMKSNKLPFDMYFLHNNDQRVRIRPKAAFWMVIGMEEIRKAICEDRDPNLDFLLDVEGSVRPDLSCPYVKHKAAKLTGIFTAKPKKEEVEKSVNPETQKLDVSLTVTDEKVLDTAIETSVEESIFVIETTNNTVAESITE